MRLIDADVLVDKFKNKDANGISLVLDRYAIKCIVSAPTIEPEQHWIPCSERLPEVGQDVLFSVQDLFVSEGCLRDDGDWSQFRWQAIQKKNSVTAWMPLPKPWRGEEHD